MNNYDSQARFLFAGIIKVLYPAGTRIKLIKMNDPQAVPSGTLGTVDFIDDDGQIHVKWDNGSSLALIYNVDSFSIIGDPDEN